MVSDEMIDDLVRQSIQASQQYQGAVRLQQQLNQKLAMQQQTLALQAAPQLRMNSLGQLECVAEDAPDTHDEWRSINADFGPEKGPE